MDIQLENIGLDFLAEFAQSTPETSFNNSSISLDIKGSFVETPTKNHKKCIHCSKKYKNTTSTTNLKRHLGLSHPNIISETSITTPDVMPGIRKPTIQENIKLNMLMLKYLILTNISFRNIEHNSFKEMIHYCNKGFKIWTRQTKEKALYNI
ncbi:unnamed protein product [Gordionus sp. m RMFG-2023]